MPRTRAQAIPKYYSAHAQFHNVVWTELAVGTDWTGGEFQVLRAGDGWPLSEKQRVYSRGELLII